MIGPRGTGAREGFAALRETGLRVMLQATDATTGATMPHTGATLWLGLRTLRNLHKGLTWAWLDTVCQYRRSKIGPLWETINVLVMTLGIAVVSSAVI